MSRNPIPPVELPPLAPGYTPRQVELDAKMVALGRPSMTIRTALDPKALAAHREAVEAWEHANGEAAADWLQLRDHAKTEEARLYEERYGPQAFAREQMRVVGFAPALIEVAMHECRDNACFTATRDWLRDGTTWCLVLSGPPGCGKSQAATWACFQLLMRRFAPRCAPCPKVSEWALYGAEADEYRWRCATLAGVLLLDDLGEGEQRHEKRSAWRAWVDDVLTQRHAARRKTIITTNRPPKELAAWLGERINDRLNEGVIISTNEPSLRSGG